MAFGAPIVFGDADLRAGIVGGDPAPESRYEFDDARERITANPGLVDVVGVPQRTRRTVATQLHGSAGVVAELTPLRIIVHGADVEEALTGIGAGARHLA